MTTRKKPPPTPVLTENADKEGARALSNTERACLILLLDGDASSIYHYGVRGRTAMASLAQSGLVVGNRLTDAGKETAAAFRIKERSP